MSARRMAPFQCGQVNRPLSTTGRWCSGGAAPVLAHHEAAHRHRKPVAVTCQALALLGSTEDTSHASWWLLQRETVPRGAA